MICSLIVTLVFSKFIPSPTRLETALRLSSNWQLDYRTKLKLINLELLADYFIRLQFVKVGDWISGELPTACLKKKNGRVITFADDTALVIKDTT